MMKRAIEPTLICAIGAAGYYQASPEQFSKEQRAAIEVLLRQHVEECDATKCDVAFWLIRMSRAMTGAREDAFLVLTLDDVRHFQRIHDDAVAAVIERKNRELVEEIARS
jgi:hypothetical protein